MVETNKQVRVDNWGIFFLQRLQLFFNRTDYCDLTLQFEGNVQLKVHRLVMNACTEYFNILEQTCEVVDGNTIIMPDDLQADVILPIVNFMYTGMLEFQMPIFDKLYRTADMMNISILLKLLDAQKKATPSLPKSQMRKAQSTYNLHGKKITPKIENDLPPTLPGRKLPVWKRKNAPTAPPATVTHYFPEPKKSLQDPLAIFDNTPKPTRFEWPEDEISSTFNLIENSSFDDISYTSKPLLTQEDELRASTSFEEIKYTPTSRKSYNSIDIDEVKNYVKEQKIRSDLVEFDDEDDPECFLDNVSMMERETKRKAKPMSPLHTKRVRFSINEKENKEAKINVTSSGKVQDMDHTKIISEVLKKYPHLVKKNKNIRLKILAKSPTKTDVQKMKTSKVKVQVTSPKSSPKAKVATGELTKSAEEGPWICKKCNINDEPIEFVLYYLYRKHMSDVHNEKFDCTMCKFCGYQSVKHNILMYHQYTRHGVKPPPAYNFPKCNKCPYIALSETLLMRHKLNHTNFDLQCSECKVGFNNQNALLAHMQITGHTGKIGRNSYDCQYCTKRYASGSNLFSHIKMIHRDEARRDGMVSIDEKEPLDDDQIEEETEEYIIPQQEVDSKEKVRILSDIKVPTTTPETSNQTTVSSRQSVPTTTSTIDAGGIATSLGLVDIVVLDENQYILHNDQQLVAQQTLGSEQREYIIPEMTEQHTFAQAQNITDVMTSLHSSDIASTDELVMVLTDHDYNDGNNEILSNENSNIVVLYSHPVDGQQNQFITSQGNIMLNSETGLLELRNPTETQVENSQEAQIESIEMIQREINSHNIITTEQEVAEKSEEYVNTDATTSEEYQTTLTQDTVILDKNFENNELITDKESENNQSVSTEATTDGIDVDRMITIEKHNIAEVISDEELIINDCLASQNEEAMDIDEECATDQENQNEVQNMVEQQSPQNEMQSKSSIIERQERREEELQEDVQNVISSKDMPDIELETHNPEVEFETDASTVESEQIEVAEEVPQVVDVQEANTMKAEEAMSVDQSHTDPGVAEHEANETNEEVPGIMESQEVIVNDVDMARAELGEETTTEMQIKDSENLETVNEETMQKVQENKEDKMEESEHLNQVESQELENYDENPQIENTENIEVSELQTNDQNVQIEETLEEITESNVQIEADHQIEIPEERVTEETTDGITESVVEMEDVEVENSQHNEETTQIQEETLQTEEEHQHDSQNSQETAQHSQIEEIQTQPEDVTSQIHETTTHIDEMAPHIDETPTSPSIDETSPHIDETAPHIDETSPHIDVTLSHVDETSSHIDETTLPNVDETTSTHIEETTSSQIEETSSQIDENSIQNESVDTLIQEETSQNSDKLEEEQEADTSSVEDENSQSQDSQISQCSSTTTTTTTTTMKQEQLLRDLKKTTRSHATKELILNDWEDTEDSQQSDNVPTKKAELTVTKLIHDWDDDDEEGHYSAS